MELLSGFRLYDAVDREHHDILLTRDEEGDLHIFVFDEEWIEIVPTFPEWDPEAFKEIERGEILVNWLGVDSRRKVIMVYSHGNNTFIPVSIAKHEERDRFGETFSEGWYAERHQLIPHSINITSSQSDSFGDLAWDSPSYVYIYSTEDIDKDHIITNHGTDPIEITDFDLVVVSSPADYEFEIISGGDPVTLQPGESHTVVVRAPARSGDALFGEIAESNLVATIAGASVSKQLSTFIGSED